MCAVPFLQNATKKEAMADYRLSAQVISRSKGQSSVASAAYRAGARLIDERTGEVHDYGRKGGVTHSQVYLPEGTPEWMADRAQLWNAVEAVERRKDAQLAREVQLSLPHELDQEQRQAMLLDFVQEQFVNHGMIADVAIHAPSGEGDDRNHHAHIMLTMRELTAEGFGNKARDWNAPERLEQWREQWAHHQNRALERHGHEARVDHRSYEAQGIDREPSQHLGSVASDMERNGKASRIGDENRAIANDNAERVSDHIEADSLRRQIEREQGKFSSWELFKRDELENAHELAALDLSQKHHHQSLRLEAELEKRHGTLKATIRAEVAAIDRRLQAKGVRRILRTVFGQARSDQQTRAEMKATLAGIERREGEERQALLRRQENERKTEARRQEKNRDRLARGVAKAKDRREAEGWTPRTSQRQSVRRSQRTGRPERAAKASPSPSQPKQPQNAPQAARSPQTTQKTPPPAPSFDKPTLAEKTRNPSSRKLEEQRGTLQRPWERSSLSNDNKRPWEGRPRGRGRKPTPDGDKSE